MQKKVAPVSLPYNRKPSVRESPMNSVLGKERSEGLVEGATEVCEDTVVFDEVVELVVLEMVVVVVVVSAAVVVMVVVVADVVVVVVVAVVLFLDESGKYVCSRQPGTTTIHDKINNIRKE